LTSTSDFQAVADATTSAAGDLFGQGGAEQKAVIDAWTKAGIKPAGTRTLGAVR